MDQIIIDGSSKILGREASFVAKQLLSNKNVVIINAEKMVISGHRKDILTKYKDLVELKDKANPEHSPYWSRRPDLFVKRVIRGMLPYKRPKGKAAYKNLRVYIGVPHNLKDAKVRVAEGKNPNEIYENIMTIKELTTLLGYKSNA
ncbi:MAG: 50S ribosomal protein L13 [Candidatus Micrarchaeota archaeon]|nr:50S ribosomal protein L13 [Candidatus Micrarchaeota archaeon]